MDITLHTRSIKERVGVGPTDSLLQDVKLSKTFPFVVIGLQFVLFLAFAFIGASPDATTPASTQLFNYYIGVSLMMFIGFGYLMTFLRWYGLGAIGLTMLVTAVGVQVSLLVEPILEGSAVSVGIYALLRANFAVAAFLISFGGLIGKVNPTQLVVLVVFESIFYCFNKQYLMIQWLALADVGGTIIIHMFGAYFGLSVAYVLGVPKNTSMEKASVTSDVFSLIGTTFLWLYWPSFVAGEIEPGTAEAELAITQTILSLLGSTVITFALSPLLNEAGKIRPVDVQNATLAGGVSIGALANLPLGPGGALLVGCVAGAISSLGFGKLQEILAAKGLHDTCGIHNLHGLPSLVGGIASIVCGFTLTSPVVGAPSVQLAGIGVTLLVSISSGAFTGFVLKKFSDGAQMSDDSAYWEVADDFGKDV